MILQMESVEWSSTTIEELVVSIATLSTFRDLRGILFNKSGTYSFRSFVIEPLCSHIQSPPSVFNTPYLLLILMKNSFFVCGNAQKASSFYETLVFAMLEPGTCPFAWNYCLDAMFCQAALLSFTLFLVHTHRVWCSAVHVNFFASNWCSVFSCLFSGSELYQNSAANPWLCQGARLQSFATS